MLYQNLELILLIKMRFVLKINIIAILFSVILTYTFFPCEEKHGAIFAG